MKRTLSGIALSAIAAVALLSARPGSVLAANCAPTQIFGQSLDLAVGTSPFHVAIGDFNNDGVGDIAVSVNLGYSAAVLLSQGNGNFAAPVIYPTGSTYGPFGLTTADFNRDGKLDLLVGNHGATSTTVKLLLGNGNGTLQPATDVASGNGSGTFAVADFDRDGFLDFCTADSPGRTMSFVRGKGNGTFYAPVLYPEGGEGFDIAQGDFNGDGAPDVVVGNENTNTVVVFINANNGTGAFAPGVSYVSGQSTYSVVVADFNGDGKLDIGAANASAGTVSVLRGLGNGTFSAATSTPAGPQTRSIAAADFDGDGDIDIAASNYDGTVHILPNRGDGTFLSQGTFFVAGRVTGVAAGDLNGDQRPDVVTANYVDFFNTSTNTISVLLNLCAEATALAPQLTDVRDVPNDEGGRVFVTWTPSSLDVSGGHDIVGYRVWRRIPPALIAAAPTIASPSPGREIRKLSARRPDGTLDVTYWEALVELPSEGLEGYGYTAPTTQDSMANGNPYTAFFVTALTPDAAVFYESNVDSGYSVDNLAPPPPTPFTATFTVSGVFLHWGANAASDLREYRIYRGASSLFVPDPSNLVGAPPDTGFFDPNGDFRSYYKISARDVHGNESSVASVSPPQPTAALISLVNSVIETDRVRLSWFAARAAGPITVWRRKDGEEWNALGRVTADGEGHFIFEDRSVQAGQRYGYRPSYVDGTETTFGDEVLVDIPEAIFGLRGIAPNPSMDGVLGVSFVLGTGASGSLEVLDLSGRRVAQVSMDGWGAGPHRVEFGRDRRLPTGLYMVRLTQERQSISAKAIVAK